MDPYSDSVSITGPFSSNATNGNWCYSFDSCSVEHVPCPDDQVHGDVRYSDPSSVWVLICSIIVFFMKAGFMLVEVSFARNVKEKRNVVITKHQDAFASAFGFFLLGFDVISRYSSPQHIHIQFFGITDPVLWFFKFTFASNAATIVGGCLVTNRYKLRLPAAFISAFVISGILHPIIAKIVWSDACTSLSPYRYCTFTTRFNQNGASCGYNCTEQLGLAQRLYVLDFAGGGAVHLLGGVAGLVICLFAKLQHVRDWNKRQQIGEGAEEGEEMKPAGFWEWMYPEHGGEETVSEAALGVIILWFCWFAFNCGSTESVETANSLFVSTTTTGSIIWPYHGIPSIIAINMILAVAAGGTTAVIIAVWAQVRSRTESLNASEIANGILSSLVAITAGCAFVDYWGACLIGFFAVLFYHGGCWLEYKLGIQDTARVVPVHGVWYVSTHFQEPTSSGLWSLIGTALFLGGTTTECNLHAAFEGLCYCHLRLPPLTYGEHILAQLIGGVVMIGIAAVGSFLMYGLLYIIPIKPFVWVFERIFFLNPGGKFPPLRYRGGWLLTSPEEDFDKMQDMAHFQSNLETSHTSSHTNLTHTTKTKATTHTARSHLGTVSSHYGTMDSIKNSTKNPSIEASVSYCKRRITPNTNSQNTLNLNGVLLEGDSSDSDQDLSIN